MHYDEVEPWVKTFNTVANKNDRGQTYEQFKTEKAENKGHEYRLCLHLDSPH